MFKFRNIRWIAGFALILGILMYSFAGFVALAEMDDADTLPPQDLTVRLETDPPSTGQVFNFTSDRLPAFTLQHNQSAVFRQLEAGGRPYRILLAEPPGWRFTRFVCDDGETETTNINNVFVNIRDKPLTCVFFVRQERGTLIARLYHDVNGNGMNDAEPALVNWQVQITDSQGTTLVGLTNASGLVTASNLLLGDYRVCSPPQPGWVYTQWGDPCVSANVSFVSPAEVSFGHYQPGTITIAKATTPAGNPQFFQFAGDLAIGSLQDGGQASATGLRPGRFSVTEVVPTGWALQDVVCVGGAVNATPIADGVTITLLSGESITCIFNNLLTQPQTGAIVVSKYHDLNANGVNDNEPLLANWPMTVFQNGAEVATGLTKENGRVRFNLPAGSYTVCETLQDGWQNSHPGTLCQPVNVVTGEVARVSFGNYMLGQIIIRKETVPGGSDQRFMFTTNYSAPFELGDGEFNASAPLPPGVYSVTEVNPGPEWQVEAFCEDDSSVNAIVLVSGKQVTCVFRNVRVTSLPRIAVRQQVNPDTLVAPGGEVVFTIEVVNESITPNTAITLSSLNSSLFDTLNGRGTCSLPQTLIVGAVYTCQFSAEVTGAAGTVITHTVTAAGSDQNGVPVTANAQAAISILDNCEAGLRRDLIGLLSAPVGNSISGTVTNTSNRTCAYQVGLASYRKFDEVIDNQEIFAWVNPTVRLAPGESYIMTIEMPTCATQVDVFYGPVLMSLKGVRYGSRLLHAVHLNGTNYCARSVSPLQPIPPQQPLPLPSEPLRGLS